MPSFGRLVAPDERDGIYPMRLRLDPLRAQFFPTGLPIGQRHYYSGSVLDQGKTGTCVGHGWSSKVHAAPIMQRLPVSPFDLYRKIVTVDEWRDNDFESVAIDADLQSGTSVRAGAKVLVSMGYASHYLWAQSGADVRAWILAGFGGCVIGVDWFDGMMRTDTDGFINLTGESVGGHCVYVNGFNDRVKHNGRMVPAVRIQNSWGKDWGQKGRAWFQLDELDALIQNRDGEACALTELRIVA